MKKCTNCHTEKPLSEFYKNTAYKDDHENICKQCKSLYYKKRFADNYSKDDFRESYKEKRKQYYKENPEIRAKANETSHRWKKENPERAKEIQLKANKKQEQKDTRVAIPKEIAKEAKAILKKPLKKLVTELLKKEIENKKNKP